MVSFVPVISVLIRMRLLPSRGGDPFSHPSGSSVARLARVSSRPAAPQLALARGARPPPGGPGARKHSVPNRVHSVETNGGSRRLVAFSRRVQTSADSRLGRITINSPGLCVPPVMFYRGDGSGRATKSPVACGRCPAPLTKFMVIAAKRRGRSSKFHVQGQKFPVHGRKGHVTSAKSVVRDSTFEVRGSKFHARGKF